MPFCASWSHVPGLEETQMRFPSPRVPICAGRDPYVRGAAPWGLILFEVVAEVNWRSKKSPRKGSLTHVHPRALRSIPVLSSCVHPGCFRFFFFFQWGISISGFGRSRKCQGCLAPSLCGDRSPRGGAAAVSLAKQAVVMQSFFRPWNPFAWSATLLLLSLAPARPPTPPQKKTTAGAATSPAAPIGGEPG